MYLKLIYVTQLKINEKFIQKNLNYILKMQMIQKIIYKKLYKKIKQSNKIYNLLINKQFKEIKNQMFNKWKKIKWFNILIKNFKKLMLIQICVLKI